MTVAQPVGMRPAARSARSVGRMRIGSLREPSGAIWLNWCRTRGLPNRSINADVYAAAASLPRIEISPSFGPELFDPASALRIGDCLIDCAVAADTAGVGQQRV
jgi:hypothetical protein